MDKCQEFVDDALEPDLDRYESAKTWNGDSISDKLLQKARKRNPRMFNEPEMLLARPASEWVDIAVQAPPSWHLFGPFWRVKELAVIWPLFGVKLFVCNV